MTEIKCGEGELAKVASQIIEKGSSFDVWCFIGDLGSGKTTIIKEICSQLGVLDNVKSPTYNIINEYLTHSGRRVNHFDFYRVNDIEEALDIGTEEYFYSGDLCLLEWPQIVKELLPENYLKVEILYSHNERLYHIEER